MPETSQTGRVEAAEARQETGPPAGDRPAEAPSLVMDDLTVEDVSIDGMCGVY